jgi:hypothetical protein
MDMKCSICGKYGIYWKNLHKVMWNQHYTYCPHCENTNCQEPEEEI